MSENQNLKTIYINSAMPQKSFAIKFYENLGFKKIGTPRIFSHSRYPEGNVEVQPMQQNMNQVLEMAESFQRPLLEKDYSVQSVDPKVYLAKYFE